MTLAPEPAPELAPEIDVLILGAGINGAGLFRDLCAQGLRCVLADKGDFAAGTSAAPSRLIHGGIKYLETGEFRLVRQSTLERNLLLRNAPHFVRPLPTVIPVFSWTRGIPAALRTLLGSATAPRARGAVLIKLGLVLYDLFGARARVMPRHRLWRRGRALAELPPLTPRIVAAGTYHDAFVTQPERLVLELVQDGLAAQPDSRALTYTQIAGTEGGTIRLQPPTGGPLRLRPRIVVNAAGPWIDAVNRRLGLQTRLIGGTKGSHLLLDHPELVRVLQGRMIYFEADDGRICLVFPYLGRALVGSTDIRADDPDSLRCDDAEIAYFLDSLRSLLPGLQFDEGQIIACYSGIRPLPRSDGTAAGMISRDHSAPVSEPAPGRPWPVISLVGGKWTTFRGFAEEVADVVLARLGRGRRVATRDLPIGGGRGFPADPALWAARLAAETGLTPDRAAELLDRYGTLAQAVAAEEAAAEAAEKAGSPRLPDAKDWSEAEIRRIAAREQVTHLEDIVLRRTPLALTGRLSARDLDRIAAIAAETLGWDAPRRAAELAATRDRLATRHRLVPR